MKKDKHELYVIAYQNENLLNQALYVKMLRNVSLTNRLHIFKLELTPNLQQATLFRTKNTLAFNRASAYISQHFINASLKWKRAFVKEIDYDMPDMRYVIRYLWDNDVNDQTYRAYVKHDYGIFWHTAFSYHATLYRDLSKVKHHMIGLRAKLKRREMKVENLDYSRVKIATYGDNGEGYVYLPRS